MEDIIMSKKLVIISGIITLAALAAAAVAYLLLGKRGVMESLDIDDEDEI